MAEKVDQMDPNEKIVEIAIERLRVFENHPFRVEMDSQMKDLQDSIKKYGIITPVIVRPRKEGYYEIISGHRRIFAAEKLGYRKVPTIIRYMTDDQAVIAMVDSKEEICMKKVLSIIMCMSLFIMWTLPVSAAEVISKENIIEKEDVSATSGSNSFSRTLSKLWYLGSILSAGKRKIDEN